MSAPEPLNDLDQFMGTGKVAKLFDVKTQTVTDWINDGKLPAEKINGRWKVRVSDVKAFGSSKFNIPIEEK